MPALDSIGASWGESCVLMLGAT